MNNIENVLVESLIKNNLKLATAESCTGGLIAQKITSVPDTSECFDCGVVTYSNDQKHKLLGVSNETLEQYGLYVLRFSNKDIDDNFEGVCRMIDRVINERIEFFR